MCDCNICPCPVINDGIICNACTKGLHFPEDIQKVLDSEFGAKEVELIKTKEIMKKKGGR